MPGAKPEPFGIVAGRGEIPAILARELVEKGLSVVAVTYYDETEEELRHVTDNVTRLGVAQVGATLDVFEKAGVKEICLIGKVDKRALFGKMKIDLTGAKIIGKLVLRNDDSVVMGVIEEIERRGFTVANQEELLKNHMPSAGVYSKREPTEKEQEDIKFGMKMARGIAGLDIGQTVVTKNQATLAAEAIEGTDEAIERGGRIAKKGAVVCKVSKPNQDPRFDVPTIGVSTIEVMASVEAKVLAVEADKTLVVNLSAVTEACDRAGIAFVAVK